MPPRRQPARRGPGARGGGKAAAASTADEVPPPEEEPVDVEQEESGRAPAASERPKKKQKHPKITGIAHWSSVETEVRGARLILLLTRSLTCRLSNRAGSMCWVLCRQQAAPGVQHASNPKQPMIKGAAYGSHAETTVRSTRLVLIRLPR